MPLPAMLRFSGSSRAAIQLGAWARKPTELPLSVDETMLCRRRLHQKKPVAGVWVDADLYSIVLHCRRLRPAAASSPLVGPEPRLSRQNWCDTTKSIGLSSAGRGVFRVLLP
jgi:hypothetical protein